MDWLLIPSNALKVIEGNYTPIGGGASAAAGAAVGAKPPSFDTNRIWERVMSNYKKAERGEEK